MSSKIQLVNYSGESTIKKFKVNKLSSPESFDDYEINIIDLSDVHVWRYDGEMPNSINIIADMKSIASMSKVTKNKILIILPQNISMKYNNIYRGGLLSSIYLKDNIGLINGIVDILLNGAFTENNFVMYNKTQSNFNGLSINSDFVFKDNRHFIPLTTSMNKKAVTTVQHGSNGFITSLNLSSERAFEVFFEELKWSTCSEEIPEWIYEEKFFDDEDLYKRMNELKAEKENIINEIKVVSEKLEENLFYKSALYESGDALVNVVNMMLKEMVGYNFENFEDKKEEDFLFEIDGDVFIGEIKGIGTNIKRSNISQTDTHRNIYIEKDENAEKNVYAIAIINRQRDLPLKKRESVPQDIIKVAKIYGVLIITMETLLRMYEKFKNKGLTKDDIVNYLKKDAGILEL